MYIDRYIRAFKCGHLKYTQLFRYASNLINYEIAVYLVHSSLYIDYYLPLISRRLVEELAATESLGGRISIMYWDTAAYATYIKPNSLGFKGWCITAPVLEIVEFDTKQIEFEDLKQFCPIAPL